MRKLDEIIFENVNVAIAEAITDSDIEKFNSERDTWEPAEPKGYQMDYTPKMYDDLYDLNKDEYNDEEKLSKDIRTKIKDMATSLSPRRIDAVQKHITDKMRSDGNDTPNYDNVNMFGNAKLATFCQVVDKIKLPIIKGVSEAEKMDKYIEEAKDAKYEIFNGESYPFYDKWRLTQKFDEFPERLRVIFGTVSNRDIELRYFVKKRQLSKYEVSGKTFAYGNEKLPPNVLIINLNSAANCPSRGLCKYDQTNTIDCQVTKNGMCYAQKDEKTHKEVELRNIRNEFMFEKIDFDDLIKLITEYIETCNFRIRHVRINESGDFKNVMQVKAADVIAGYLKKRYGINTSCYCNNLSLTSAFGDCENLILNASSIAFMGNCTRLYYGMRKEFFTDVLKDTQIDGRVKHRTLPNGEIQDYFICGCNCYKCSMCYSTLEEAESKYGELKSPNKKLFVYCPEH